MLLSRKSHLTAAENHSFAIEVRVELPSGKAVSALLSLANLCWDMNVDRPKTRSWFILAHRAFGVGIIDASVVASMPVQMTALRSCVNIALGWDTALFVLNTYQLGRQIQLEEWHYTALSKWTYIESVAARSSQALGTYMLVNRDTTPGMIHAPLFLVPFSLVKCYWSAI